MDPTSIGLRAGGGALWSLLKSFTTDEQYKQRRDRLMFDWSAEIAEQLRSLEARFDNLAKKLDDQAKSDFFGTYASFTPAAMGALSKAHRSLYAAAVANVLRPDFDVETKSRVLRAIHQLEPGDVVHLRTLGAEVSDIGAATERIYRRAELLSSKAPAAVLEVFREAALEGAHCLTDRGHITPLGREVVRFLEAWDPGHGKTE